MSDKIYHNTIWLSFRHIANIFSSLIIVRILLLGLGENGYALMALIMGVTASVSFLKDAFSGILQRYYSISLGSQRFEKDLLTTLIYLIIFTSVAVIIGYSFSKLYLINRLTSSYGLAYKYHLLIACAIFVLVLQFLSSVPIAIAIASEKMAVLFFVSIIESLLKLILGLIIWQFSFNVIDTYFIGIVIINAFVFLSLLFSVRHILLNLNWANFSIDRAYLAGFTSYINWSLIGEGSNKFKDQLVIYVFEWFFTPSIVVARALSYQVAWSISGLPFSFTSSLTPSLTKKYHRGELQALKNELIISIDLLINALIILGFAIITILPDFLTLWLPDIPEKTFEITCLIIAEILCLVLSLPIMAVINAAGKVKEVNIFQCLLFLMVSVVIIILGRLGFDALVIVLISTIASLINLIYRANVLSRITTINVLKEIKLSKGTVNIIVSCIFGYIFSSYFIHIAWLNILFSSIFFVLLFYTIVLRWNQKKNLEF